MFGYVRPSVRDLPEEELDRFRAMYCGLCHTLSRRYGQAARFILNYDFTYLAILLSDGTAGAQGAGRCYTGQAPVCWNPLTNGRRPFDRNSIRQCAASFSS